MPRGRRASAPDLSSTLVLGLVGTGDLDDAEVEETLKNLFAQDGVEKVECVFALTDEAVGDGAWKAFEFIADNTGKELALAAVTAGADAGDKDDKALHKEAVDAKARIIALGDRAAVTVADELVTAKQKGADARLLVFWFDEPEDNVDTGGQYAALETATAGGVPAFNLCNAMDVLDLGDPEPEAAPDPEPEPEAAPRRSRRGRAAAAEDEAPAAEPAAEEEPPRRRRSTRKAADDQVAEEAYGDEAQASVPAQARPVETKVASNGFDSALREFARMLAEEIVRLADSPNGSAKEPAEAAPARRRRSS